MTRGDWLFLALLFVSFVLVFWAVFGQIVWKALGG